MAPSNIVARFDPGRDFYIGPTNPRVVMIEYGDYLDPITGRARDILLRTAERLPEATVFAYRQLPSDRPEALLAARAAVAAGRQGAFWKMHDALFRSCEEINVTTLSSLAAGLDLDLPRFEHDLGSAETLRQIEEDRVSANAAGVTQAPALFIDGRRYRGVWDELALLEAIERPLGLRLRLAGQAFFDWAASAGVVLVAATLLALLVANSEWREGYERFREMPLGLTFGASDFSLPLHAWVNDGLMALFFLLVGLEIKRELVSGELSNLDRAKLPLIGALGGMAVPALIYATLNFGTPEIIGWGIPMATDIAFTLGIMALLGNRVPNALVVFISALAIADDLGAVLVIAIFYSSGIALGPLLVAAGLFGAMLLLNRSSIYSRTPYLLLGAALWVNIHESGLHATLAGVLTAIAIPSRPAANLAGVAAQTTAIFRSEVRRREQDAEEPTEIGPGALKALQRAVERLREPGYHLQNRLENWTRFLVLPLFAFVNTGISIESSTFAPLSGPGAGVILGLVIGKPLGIVGLCWLAVRLRVAELSAEISWSQLVGAGILAGVGFTMSIFIAGAGFDGPELQAIKLSILLASIVAGGIGSLVLAKAAWRGRAA
ncbi:Na+/H+ antiporter NhaA [Sphingosinicella sp. CPCC 101087]|uniref:Na+/H+ antiporter NhaA n=1 Tax=Sphingosinicella sp. CPCC 101087 TaxID=2497754 RepID=UPI00101CFA98|nr:Na+/H+ antiporter NhaA [Sphingosinicella sp. CPCC 101087]